MCCPFYRIFVGRFEKPADTKSTSEKLRKLGLTPSVFKYENGYSLLIASTLKREHAEAMLLKLLRKEFDAFLDEPKN